MSRSQHGFGAYGLALVSLTLAHCASAPPPELEPISYQRGESTIQLAFLGRYTMGFFGVGGAEPAVYDPHSRRLFVLNADRGWIDAVDIADPGAPKLVHRQVLLGYGGSPESIALRRGILAVAFWSPIGTMPGKVLFFDTDGKRTGDIVRVGTKPVQLRFTPDGRRLVVVNHGEANDSYTIDPEGSVSIIDLGIANAECRGAACAITPQALQLDFEAFNDQESALVRDGVRIYGPGASVAQDLEPESVAIAPDGGTAWVVLQRNNAMAVIDLTSRRIARIFALGTKDHGRPGAGLDGSSVDGEINIRPWPIEGLYMPDGFAAYEVEGATYLVTANEGDPRESAGFVEETRLRTLTLDPEVFPNAVVLQQDRNLGLLRVSSVDGDVDGDDAFDRILSYGGRSFAIWTGEGELVFDSGDDLEQIMAEAIPSCFNCSGGSIGLDERSDDRGPEPEALAIGRIDNRDYAFIAPERIGGVYVYDITEPRAPVFQQYINFRDFSVDPGEVCEEKRPVSEPCAAAGDLEPEGVLFIAAADSPIGVPLVVLTHELSTSATIYRVDEVR
jgi:2',3'-cyclic-nucleotide 2'-phosphodiesterase / 3'-nucleotidase / 5'-nucleotidase